MILVDVNALLSVRGDQECSGVSAADVGIVRAEVCGMGRHRMSMAER